jgi:cellulose synthase/poly-beta-1,6-N-acetylglucosamine synthase-like glycosyltransferase
LSRARNHALAQAQYDLVAFTDDDTHVDRGWPAALAAGFEHDPRTVCVTGFITASALETACEQYFDARYTRRSGFTPLNYDLRSETIPLYPYNAGVFGMGANFAIHREAAIQLGGFDPLLGVGSQGRGGEDLDMFLRIVLSGGHICYMPSALVWHRHRVDTAALSEQIYSYGHGLGAYLAKHSADLQFRRALLSHGFLQARQLVGQMRRASQVSHVGTGGIRLAFTEASGVVAGAIRDWLARRPAWSSSSP